MNQISTKEYNNRKDSTVAVISFNIQTQLRDCGYGNISLFSAIDEIMRKQRFGYVSMIITMSQWDIMNTLERTTKDRISMVELLNIIRTENIEIVA